MSLEQLERDVAELKQQVAGLLAQQQATPKIIGPSPYSRWWEKLPPPLTYVETEEERHFSEAVTKYIRQTGDAPPPDWKPGDPIPEPEHWK
jgi:hypothetical protein